MSENNPREFFLHLNSGDFKLPKFEIAGFDCTYSPSLLELCWGIINRCTCTGMTRKFLLTVMSSSTTFPTQNNISLVAKILLDFFFWSVHRNGVLTFLPYSKGVKYT